MTAEEKLQKAITGVYTNLEDKIRHLLQWGDMEFIDEEDSEVFGPFEDLPPLTGQALPDGNVGERLFDKIVQYRLEHSIVEASSVEWLYTPVVLQGVKDYLEEFCDTCDDADEYSGMQVFLSRMRDLHEMMKLVGTRKDIKKTKMWCLELPS